MDESLTKTLDDPAAVARRDAESAPDGLAPGVVMGRYCVSEQLGRGGMGEVWLAHDTELDRDVALKVLRRDGRGSQRSDRMLREAQAMARLRHPNVITVYDVGTFGRRVFVAMEYVQGQTLSSWLAAAPRTIAEILTVFDGAALGLSAAHAAGLVHRDFKPDNVMVDAEGRVQVMDFGLARTPGTSDLDPPSGEVEVSLGRSTDENLSGPSLISQRLTATGAVLGTPAYMAPEQHLRLGANPHSDQFAFGVALYEALYGERPFAGGSALVLAANVTSGSVRPAPRDSKVPPRLRRVLLRTLSREADDRYPSMKALRGALDRATARQRWPLFAAGTVVLAGGLTLIRSGEPADPCFGAAQAITPAWEDTTRERARAAFAATELGFAAETFERVDVQATEYSAQLHAEALEACRDTRVRGVQSEVALDRRLACVHDNNMRLTAFARQAAEADVDVVMNAGQALASLPPPVLCRHTRRVAADRAGGDEIPSELRDQFQEVHAALGLQRVRVALELLDDLRGTIDDQTVTPELVVMLSLRGRAHAMLDEFAPAAAANERALWAAVEIGWDEQAVRVTSELMYESMATEPKAAARWIAHGDALLRRLDGGPPELVLLFEHARIRWHAFGGEHAVVEQLARKALATTDPEVVAPGSLLELRNALSRALARQGKLRDATDEMRILIDAEIALLGPEHPHVARVRLDLADLLSETGDHDAATAEANAALGILERGYERLPESYNRALGSLALVRMRRGDFDEAIPFLERQVAQRQRAAEGPDMHVADAHSKLGVAYWYTGRYVEAEERHRRAREIAVATVGPDHPITATYMDNLATALERQGRFDEALELHEAALPILEAKFGAASPTVAVSLRDQARALASAKRWKEAAAMLERSAQIYSQAGSDVVEVAETRFDLARALWQTPNAHPRAISLAHDARRSYEAAGRTKEVATIDAWLQARVGVEGSVPAPE
ncbi:MAG: serine/threonine-protein kinase [Myxococcota bacterium]